MLTKLLTWSLRSTIYKDPYVHMLPALLVSIYVEESVFALVRLVVSYLFFSHWITNPPTSGSI